MARDDLNFDIKIDVKAARASLMDLHKELEKLKKGFGFGGFKPPKIPPIPMPKPDVLAFKEYKNYAQIASTATTRLGRELDALNAEFGIGSKQSKAFSSAMLKESQVTKALAEANKRLLNLRRTGQISASKARLEYEKLTKTMTLFRNKMMMSTPMRSIQANLARISNMLGVVSPELSMATSWASQFGESLKALTGNSKMLLGTLTGVGAALGVIVNTKLASAAISTGKSFEDMEYQMTALINSTTKFRNKETGEFASLEKNLELSLGNSKKIIQQFVEDAPALAGTSLQELTATASVTLGRLGAVGITDPKEQAKLIEGMTVAIKTITKGQANAAIQLAQESRALLQGEFKATNTLINQLAVAAGGKDRFKQMMEEAKAAGKFGQFLEEQLKSYVAAAKFGGKSLSNSFEVMSDVYTNFMKGVSDRGVLQEAKNVMKELLGIFAFNDLGEGSTFGMLTEDSKKLMDEVGRNLTRFVRSIIPYIQPLGKLFVQLGRLLSQFGTIAAQVFESLSPIIVPIINTISKVFEGIADALQSTSDLIDPFVKMLGKIGVWMNKNIEGMEDWSKATKALGAVITTAILYWFNPFLGILAGVSAALNAMGFNTGKIGEMIAETLNLAWIEIQKFWNQFQLWLKSGKGKKANINEINDLVFNQARLEKESVKSRAKLKGIDIKASKDPYEPTASGGKTPPPDTRKLDLAQRELELKRQLNELDSKALGIEEEKSRSQKERIQLELDSVQQRLGLEEDKRKLDYRRSLIELAYEQGDISERQKILELANVQRLEDELDIQNKAIALYQQEDALLLDIKDSRFEIQKQLVEEEKAQAKILTMQKNIASLQALLAKSKLPEEQQKIREKITAEQAKLEDLESNRTELIRKNLIALGGITEEQRSQLLVELQSEKVSLERLKNEGLLTAEAQKRLGIIQAEMNALSGEEEQKKQGRQVQTARDLQKVNNQFLDGLKDAGKGLFTDIFTALREGGSSVGKSILDALKNFGAKILDKITDQFASGLTSSLFGGGGGFNFGSLFGGMGGGGSPASGFTGNLRKNDMGFFEAEKLDGTFQELNTQCGIAAKKMIGLQGASGGLMGIFKQLISSIGGLVEKAVNGISKMFGGKGGFSFGAKGGAGGGIMGKLGGLGGIASAAMAVGGIAFGAFSAISGFRKSRKAKKEKAAYEKAINAYNGFVKTIEDSLELATKDFENTSKEIKRAIGKLDLSSSVYNIQKAIDLSMKGLDKTNETIQSIYSEIEKLEGYKTRRIDNKRARGEIFASIDAKVKELRNQAESLEDETLSWLDEMEKFVKDQKNLIYNFQKEVKFEEVEMMFGEGAGDLYSQITAFNERVNELLLSGYDPEQVGFLIQRQGAKLQRDVVEATQEAKDTFANSILELNQELTSVLSEGRVTGQIKQTQQDRVKSIRDRIDALYKEQAEAADSQLFKFGENLNQANAALEYFNNMIQSNFAQALDNARLEQTLLDRIEVSIYTPQEIADVVDSKLKQTPWLTGALL